MTLEVYSPEEVDQLIAGMYTQEQVDALLGGLQAQIDSLRSPHVDPPVVPVGKIIGSGDMTAFRGLKISGHRTYNGFGVQRQYNPTVALAQVKADEAAGRKPYFSIGAGNNKAHPGGPQDFPTTLSGLPADTFIPAVKVVADAKGTLIIHHEPEDDPGSAMNFKTFFGLMSDFYRKAAPGIRIGLCLMAWTGRKGGPGFQTWTPDPAKFDVFCIDGYAHDVGDTAGGLFANALAFSRSIKKPLMITETGQENNVDQIPFLSSLHTFVQQNADVEGFLYWNGGSGVQSKGGHNYHLQPDALGHYAQMVGSGAYAQAKLSV